MVSLGVGDSEGVASVEVGAGVGVAHTFGGRCPPLPVPVPWVPPTFVFGVSVL
jgi:hypothetical protein